MFYSEIISGLQKSCKNTTKNSRTPLPRMPEMLTSYHVCVIIFSFSLPPHVFLGHLKVSGSHMLLCLFVSRHFRVCVPKGRPSLTESRHRDHPDVTLHQMLMLHHLRCSWLPASPGGLLLYPWPEASTSSSSLPSGLGCQRTPQHLHVTQLRENLWLTGPANPSINSLFPHPICPQVRLIHFLEDIPGDSSQSHHILKASSSERRPHWEGKVRHGEYSQ